MERNGAVGLGVIFGFHGATGVGPATVERRSARDRWGLLDLEGWRRPLA
jgi:hypothetical protein